MDSNNLKSAKTTVETKPLNPKVEQDNLSATNIKGRPAKYGQWGKAVSYVSSGEGFEPTKKPHYYQLAAWDNARLKEPIIKNGIEKVVLYVCKKLGHYHHPNKMIEDFVRANIEDYLPKWIEEMTSSAFWSGFGVGEILWEKKIGPNNLRQIWLNDIVNYHPTQVDFRLNDNSRLTHGEKREHDNYLSGIWVTAPNTMKAYKSKTKHNFNNYDGSRIRLHESKVFHVAFGGAHNNPWGESRLTSVLEYHLFKEAFRDMMAIALDRYGTPLLYAIVPPQSTSEIITEPDGSQRNKTYREAVAEVMGDVRGNQAIVLEQLSKDYPVNLGSLTTGNNFSDVFNKAIDFCDNNMQIGLGIPNLIMRDERSGLGSGKSSENQVEMFNIMVGHIFQIVTKAFTHQVIKQLIAFNFDPYTVADIHVPGFIAERPLRPTEIEVLTKSYKTLTELGLVNPSNQDDYNQIRDMFGLSQRSVDKFCKDMTNYISGKKPISKSNEETLKEEASKEEAPKKEAPPQKLDELLTPLEEEEV